MDEVMNSYTLAIDELNILTATSYYAANGDIDKITDDFLSFLINGYTLGISNASKMLAYQLPVDVSKMEEAIYLVIDGKTFKDRIADHVLANDLPGLQMLAESEYHRVYNTAVVDGGREYTGGVNKTWRTMLDDRVRETHDYLENMTVGLNERFYTYDGDSALFPGGFTKAENNVNCRCIVVLTKRK